jgi:hypothetical protein
VHFAARVTLADCRAALRALGAVRSAQEYRLLWISGLALVRAVGHVLKNVDCTANPELKVALDQNWPVWKEEPLFSEFIEPERNLILKEYSFGYQEGVVPVRVGISVHDLGADNLFRPLQQGHFAGEDGRDVLAEAIEWWEEKLAVLEQQLRSGP